ncbi:MAG: superoxide dismutase [Ramlibacter sp.]|nr:superoxide dismutase [Ramlibacter sp.]
MAQRTLSLLAAAAIAGVLAGCAAPIISGPRATATLVPTSGNSAAGVVQFVQHPGRVLVQGEVSGLRPGAQHGFHVHEKGDCSSGDGMSAGGHFNPGGKPHGNHDMGEHHAGDLPSLRADADGVARFRFESSSISVGAGAADIVGKGLIVHRDPDDFVTQPAGNAGPRLACAVIGS